MDKEALESLPSVVRQGVAFSPFSAEHRQQLCKLLEVGMQTYYADHPAQWQAFVQAVERVE